MVYDWRPKFYPKCLVVGHICQDRPPPKDPAKPRGRKQGSKKVELIWQPKEINIAEPPGVDADIKTLAVAEELHVNENSTVENCTKSLTDSLYAETDKSRTIIKNIANKLDEMAEAKSEKGKDKIQELDYEKFPILGTVPIRKKDR